MLVLVKGAGDLASGVALRLKRCHFDVAMTDLANPTAIRRTVCFSEAIRAGSMCVEGITAFFAQDISAARDVLARGDIPVFADESAATALQLSPDVLVDAVVAKRNTGTKMTDAPLVLALGPGFVAGADCHAVIETMRGHTLGRVIYEGSALPNTGMPGELGGHSHERVLRAPKQGFFEPLVCIGDRVTPGDICARVDGEPLITAIQGVVRGILPEGTPVHRGMKSGDVDPRCEISHCYSVSDKALAIAGGVLEAILHFTNQQKGGL